MEIFSGIDLVNQCLIDDKKIKAYKKAILENVDKNTVVLETGVGTGVLSMIAAKAGAKKVYSVDIDPYVLKLAKKTIHDNNYDETIELIKGDASKIKYGALSHIDLLITEILTTGMVDEQQAKILNNLHSQKIIDNKTKILPFRLDTTVQLVEADFGLYGFKFPIVKHLWKQYDNNPIFQRVSNKILLNSYYFNNPVLEKFSKKVEFELKTNSKVNGILLESVAWLTKNIKCADTVAFLAPVIFPITPKNLRKDEKVNFEISYILGRGYKNFKADFIQK